MKAPIAASSDLISINDFAHNGMSLIASVTMLLLRLLFLEIKRDDVLKCDGLLPLLKVFKWQVKGHGEDRELGVQNYK